VRADLEAAARLLQRRALKHTDSAGSGSSAATSCFMMPPPPGADVAHAAGGERQRQHLESVSTAGQHHAGVCGRSPAQQHAALKRNTRTRLPHAQNHAGTSPRASPAATPGSASTPAPLTLRAFCGVMEEVVSAGRRGAPRAYLAPSPPRKALPQESHVPVINARSKVLASRVRPKVRVTGLVCVGGGGGCCLLHGAGWGVRCGARPTPQHHSHKLMRTRGTRPRAHAPHHAGHAGV
jgi:hypothetical protein